MKPSVFYTDDYGDIKIGSISILKTEVGSQEFLIQYVKNILKTNFSDIKNHKNYGIGKTSNFMGRLMTNELLGDIAERIESALYKDGFISQYYTFEILFEDLKQANNKQEPTANFEIIATSNSLRNYAFRKNIQIPLVWDNNFGEFINV